MLHGFFKQRYTIGFISAIAELLVAVDMHTLHALAPCKQLLHFFTKTMSRYAKMRCSFPSCPHANVSDL